MEFRKFPRAFARSPAVSQPHLAAESDSARSTNPSRSSSDHDTRVGATRGLAGWGRIGSQSDGSKERNKGEGRHERRPPDAIARHGARPDRWIDHGRGPSLHGGMLAVRRPPPRLHRRRRQRMRRRGGIPGRSTRDDERRRRDPRVPQHPLGGRRRPGERPSHPPRQARGPPGSAPPLRQVPRRRAVQAVVDDPDVGRRRRRPRQRVVLHGVGRPGGDAVRGLRTGRRCDARRRGSNHLRRISVHAQRARQRLPQHRRFIFRRRSERRFIWTWTRR